METTVNFVSDGIGLTPAEFAQVLQESVADQSPEIDSYALGGAVAEVEATFARLLGKERALFLPTGTMANHLALRTLAGDRRRVIVPADSHIYRDIGDSATTLSGLNLIALAPGRPGFTVDEVRQAIASWADERVATGLGAIAIESMVRRHHDVMLDGEQIRQVTDFARAEGIGTHLDGARLFKEAVHRGVTPAELAAGFDTVFVSLSKCFNCASGAVLAGPARLIDGLFHERRMFGGSLPQAWPQATVALHYAESFLQDYRQSVGAAEELFAALEESGRFRVERFERGTHLVRLHVLDGAASELVGRLAEAGVRLNAPAEGDANLLLKINPSILRRSPEELASAFLRAAGG